MSRISSRAVAVLTSSAAVFTTFGIIALANQKPVEALAAPPNFVSKTGSKLTAATSTSRLAAEKRPGNPFQTLIGDFASSLTSSISGGSSSTMNPNRDSKLASMASSWDEIQSDLESKQTSEEKAFRSNVEKGIGPPSPLNKIRLFHEGNKEEEIRVTFYRDHASWCPYCQKVWMFLEEKKIPYRVEKINMRCYGDKPASFQRLQPNGAIPVARIDGKVYNQSNDIIYTLEQLFQDGEHKAMLPPQTDTDKRMKAQSLLRLERTLFSAWMYWLTGSEQSKGNFIRILKEVEDELSMSEGDFFLGNEISLVDCMFAPFLERIVASIAFFKGFQIRVIQGADTDFPAINKWFDAMETLESYTVTKGCYYSHAYDLPPQLGGCSYAPGGEPYVKAINGERLIDGSRGSWELPLEPHLGGVEPDWAWLGDDNAAKREAVERLSFNHKAIVAFAARGAGKKGMPPFSAPLSDPYAVPNDSVKGSVDALLRIVSLAMLNGIDSTTEDLENIVSAISEDGDAAHVDNVVTSLAYLRDRIGVPRDMRLPAARQLRAHLNFVIEKMI